MLHRFAAGTIVSSCLIALGGAVVLALRLPTGDNFYWMAALWCLVPFLWGVWMMLAPQSWIEKRLPAWGAILGALAGISGLYVLDVPRRVAGIVIPAALRPVGVLLAAAIYGAVWIVVAKVYRALAPTPTNRTTSAAA
jgi:hypothetical protein